MRQDATLAAASWTLIAMSVLLALTAVSPSAPQDGAPPTCARPASCARDTTTAGVPPPSVAGARSNAIR
jgi:hypothetical protein